MYLSDPYLTTEEDLYRYDYAFLKKMGAHYKLVRCNKVRRPGYEAIGSTQETEGCWIGGIRKEDPDFGPVCVGGHFASMKYTYLSEIKKNISCRIMPHPADENKLVRSTCYLNDEKLENNIIRAKNKIIEIGYCNDFDYFVTLTIDKDKQDRFDLREYIKDLGYMIQNLNARTNAQIRYILIPERHKNGAWHLHGLMTGFHPDMLQQFVKEDPRKLPVRILDGLKNGETLYEWLDYSKRFGFCTLSKIRNREAALHYILKYINKEVTLSIKELGQHIYYCSKGLKRAEVIAEGQWLRDDFKWDCIHRYGSYSWYHEMTDDMLAELINCIGSESITMQERKQGYKDLKEGDDTWTYFCDPDTGEILSRKGSEMYAYATDDVWSAPDIREFLPDKQTHDNEDVAPPAIRRHRRTAKRLPMPTVPDGQLVMDIQKGGDLNV